VRDNTKIEWADSTLNYANGCSLASPGCTNCYAMKQAHRFPVRQGLTQQSKGGMVWTSEVRMNDKALQQALAWKRGRKIFWNAHGDLFHENVTDAQIDRLFAVCALTPQHTHMILTKRSARMREYMRDRARITADHNGLALIAMAAEALGHDVVPGELRSRWPLPNVWLGVSVEDQQRADERIPDLLATPAAVRFISAEPLLGPVDLTGWLWGRAEPCPGCPKDMDCSCGMYPRHMLGEEPDLAWVIVGGESGHKARPMANEWAQSLVDQCQAAGVAAFVKQLSSGGSRPIKDIEHFPVDLQVREFPHAR
jgi:protein gp37